MEKDDLLKLTAWPEREEAMRSWRRASLATVWFPETKVGPCHRGHLIIQQQRWWGIERREYAVRTTPTGQFAIEHEWSMK